MYGKKPLALFRQILVDYPQCWIKVRKKYVTSDKNTHSFLFIPFCKNIEKFFFLSWIILWFLVIPINSYSTEWVRAKWVADGDTIVLVNGDLIRYIGIDAPEIDHKSNIAEPYGFDSMNFNKKLVLNKKLRLEFDHHHQDRYGRQLAYVFLENGIFVNQALLENGYAFYQYHKANQKYHELLIQKQQEAMVAKRGIWKNWKEKEGSYIGNLNSKRFHISACPSGKKTIPKNKILFGKSWDAFRQGYSPCRQCLNIGDFTYHDP
jgi:micrococcal nuclease